MRKYISFACICIVACISTAYSQISISPSSLDTNIEKTTISTNFGRTVSYKILYTVNQSFPSSGMYGGYKQYDTQNFWAHGTWYLHVHNVSTGEKKTGGPYRRDLAAPNNPNINYPSGWTNSAATVSLSSAGDNGSSESSQGWTSYTSGVNRLEYSVGYGWNRYSSSVQFNSDGWHNFTGRAIDNVGNASGGASISFGIDRVRPTLTSSIPSSSWTNGNVGINMAASDDRSGVNNVALYRNGSHVSTGGSNVVYTEYNEGSYSFVARATDNAGNQQDRNFSVNIDKTNPVSSQSLSPSGWTNGNVNINVSANDSRSGIKRVVAPNGATGVSSVGYTATSNGSYRFVYEDNAGNSAYRDVIVNNIDRAPPSIQITGVPSSWVTSAVLQITASDSQSGVSRIVLPNGSVVNGNSATYRVNSVGEYSFDVFDNVGNKSVRKVYVDKIDTNGPSISISGDLNGWISRNASVSISATDDKSGVNRIEYSTSGAVNTGWTTYNGKIAIAAEGVTVVSARAYDNLGNVSNVVSGTVRIDKTAPVGSVTTKSVVDDRKITINVKGLSDSMSGVKDVVISNKADFSDKVKVVGFAGKDSMNIDFELDKKSTQVENYSKRTVYIRFVDMVGNVRNASCMVELRPKPPVLPIISKPVNDTVYSNGEQVSINWVYDDINTDVGKMPQIKATITLRHVDTGKTSIIDVKGDTNMYNLGALEVGTYEVDVRVYNWETVSSVSSKTMFRVGIYKDSGNVRTVDIDYEGGYLTYISIMTDYEMPVGTNISGRIYYEHNNGKFNYNVFKVFEVASSGELIKLPSKSDKVKIEYVMKNTTAGKDKTLTPKIDGIRVMAK